MTWKIRWYLHDKRHILEFGRIISAALVRSYKKKIQQSNRPKVITYRSYKKFHEEKVLNDLKETNIIMNENDPNQNYQSLTKTFLTIVNKHGPLKKKIVRGNQAPFMTKGFQKAIYTRRRLKNKINKNPTEKKQRLTKDNETCVSH